MRQLLFLLPRGNQNLLYLDEVKPTGQNKTRNGAETYSLCGLAT